MQHFMSKVLLHPNSLQFVSNSVVLIELSTKYYDKYKAYAIVYPTYPSKLRNIIFIKLHERHFKHLFSILHAFVVKTVLMYSH